MADRFQEIKAVFEDDLALHHGAIEWLITEIETLRKELDLIKHSQRITCSCRKDTASILWAQCYDCRQKAASAFDEVDELKTKLDVLRKENARLVETIKVLGGI